MLAEREMQHHRDAALKLLSENQDQFRAGVELLVRDRLAALARAAHPPGAPPLEPAQAEALYGEVLILAYNLFALGYTAARATGPGR